MNSRNGSADAAAHHRGSSRQHGERSQRLRPQRLKTQSLKSSSRRTRLRSNSGIDIGDVVDLCLPARFAALDRKLPATRRPLRPCGRWHPEGRLFHSRPVTTSLNARPSWTRSSLGNLIGLQFPDRAARRAGAADRGRGGDAGLGRSGRSLSDCGARGLPQAGQREDSMPTSRMLAEGHDAPRPLGADQSTASYHHPLRGRRGRAHTTALTPAARIPDTADYRVFTELRTT